MGGVKRKSSSKTLAKGNKKKGPHLPNSILRTIANEKRPLNSDEEDDEIDSDDETGGDLYEYEEGVPEEESRKNKRYGDAVNYEYELPENFEDENVESEDDDDDDEDGGNSDIDEKAEGDRHTRMLQALTGMPSAAFEGESKSKPVLVTEAYPESEFNPTRDVLEGKGLLTLEDLLAPLKGKPGYNQLRKRTSQIQKDTQSVVHAPLPKPERERLERKVVQKEFDKGMDTWVHQVKRNREAPTVYFNQNVNLGYSTVGAIASEFKPRTEFEMKMASILNNNKVREAHQEDGAKLLELNEVSMEDHIKDRNHSAKMRSLLFRQDLKSKRIKKIKSKTYHRLKKKDLMKSGLGGALMDPEMAKEEAMKQEVKRVEERMTLKHKNTSKWAKRMISRGLNVKYDGTRAAIAEQLQINANLSRKMNSMKDGSSSDESDDEEDYDDGSDQDTPSKLIAKAKKKTLKTLEDDEVPNAGLLSLPFMVRAMDKKKEEAKEEAKRALEEYDEWENSGGAESPKKSVNVSGRRVFGATAKVEAPKESKKESDNFYDTSDSDNDMDGIKDNDLEAVRDNDSPARNSGTITETELDDISGNPASKTTYDVAIMVSGSRKKMTGSKNTESKKPSKTHVPISQDQDKKESRDEESEDSESEAEQMVDGELTSAPRETFEIPSQAELINRAFAGDDVVDEFEKDKQEILNQEVPEPEKPTLVPGWGQWTNIQNKRGLPSWMVREHEDAKKKREQALKTRKDASLKHVIISEKVDKRAEKLYTTTLPFPYTSKEVFEGSMRMPIGPEFNPATTVPELNLPEVVKKAGVIIQPIKFEKVNPNEKVDDDEHPRSHQKQRPKNKKGSKSSGGQNKVKSKTKA